MNAMRTHTVKKGECLSSLAHKYGFDDPNIIYSHPQNAPLKQMRSNPNVLRVGDRVHIPDRQDSSEQVNDGSRHTFRAGGLRTHLRFVIEDFEGNALAGKEYELEVGMASFSGRTGAEGLVENLVPASEMRGRLTVWLDDSKTSFLVWNLELGTLEPHDEIRGMQARLNNLGFPCGKVDGLVGPKTRAAVQAFKKKNGIGDNDTIDDATQNKIRDVYGF
jgi:hypothetical protein